MWKDWTRKIKTFAEDITSPDFEDERPGGGSSEEEEENEKAYHDRPTRSARAEAAHPQRGGYAAHGDGPSVLLETPARRLERHYDEPTLERRAGDGPPAEQALHNVSSGASAQPSPALAPAPAAIVTSAAGLSAAPTETPQRFSAEDDIEDALYTSKQEEEEEDTDGSSLHRVPGPSSSSLPLATNVPRRGPPMARATPQQQQQQQHQRDERQASSHPPAAASPSSSPSLSSSSVAKALATTTGDADKAAELPMATAHLASSSAPTPPTTKSEKEAPPSSASTMALQQRVVQLEAEKAQMMADIRMYQDEVRVAHEQTVAYYEAQLSKTQQEAANAAALLAMENTQGQLKTLQATLDAAGEELAKEKTTHSDMLQRLSQLEEENAALRTKVAQAETRLEAAAAAEAEDLRPAHTDAEWEEKQQECLALRAALTLLEEEQRVAQATAANMAAAAREELEAQLRAAQSELADVRRVASIRSMTTEPVPNEHTEELAAVQEELESWRRKAEALEKKNVSLASAAPSSHEGTDEVVSALRQELQAAETGRCNAEQQLRDAQAKWMASLAAANEKDCRAMQQQREAEEEELGSMSLEVQKAKQQVAQLEHELATVHQQNTHLTAQLAEEQAKGTAAHSSSIATSARASADKAVLLSRKLQESEAQCGALRNEVQQSKQTIDQLTQQLKADAQTQEKAYAQLEEEHAEAEAELEDEVAAVKAEAAKAQQACEARLQKVIAELQEAQKHAAQLEEEMETVRLARDAAEAKARVSSQQCKTRGEECAVLQQQLQRSKEDIAEQQAELKRLASQEANSGASISLASLTNVKRELEDKVQNFEVTVEQVRRMTVDALVRLGVDITQAVQQRSVSKSQGPSSHQSENSKKSGNAGAHSSRSTSEGSDSSDASQEDDGVQHATSRQQKAQQQLPLLQLLSLLTTECMQQHAIVLRAERVQQEWEQTYEQARQVNASLNQQVAEAWATIGKLREDISVKDATTRQMQSRVGSGDARLMEVQEELTRVTSEVQHLREERDGWAARLHDAEAAAESQEAAVASLREELHAAQAMLQVKEEEVLSSQQIVENLQMVLDRFQDTKRQDVETLTLEAHMEAEALRKEAEESRRVMGQHEQAKAALREAYEAQLAAKDAEVTTLYRKLAEVRKVLEKTTSRHMDGTDTSVDKRVVSQLLAKYIHAFIGQRKEAEDMLKVLSGLLDWDEATQEAAGLLPGPNNPHPPGSGPNGGQGGGRAGLFGWRRGKTTATPGSALPATSGTEAKAKTNKAGLASMWVEFLLKESEGGAASAAETPSTPAGASTTEPAAASVMLNASSASSTTTPAAA